MNIFTFRKQSQSFLIIGAIIFALLIVFLSISFVYAQNNTNDPLTPPQGLVPCSGIGDCNLCTLIELGRNIMNWLVAFSVFVAVLIFVYAGFLFLSAGGNEGQVSKGKQMFWSVFIGFVIILGAWLVIDAVMVSLYRGNAPSGEDRRGFGPWNGAFDCGQTTSFTPADFGGTGLGTGSGSGSGGTENPPITPTTPQALQQTFERAFAFALVTPNQRDNTIALGDDIVFVFDTPTFRQTEYFFTGGQFTQSQAHQEVFDRCRAVGGRTVNSIGTPSSPDIWRAVCVTSVPTSPPSVSVTLTADRTTITAGEFSILQWNATPAGDVATCVGTGEGFDGSKTTSDFADVSPSVTTTYRITCNSKEVSGQINTDTASIEITVIPTTQAGN